MLAITPIVRCALLAILGALLMTSIGFAQTSQKKPAAADGVSRPPRATSTEAPSRPRQDGSLRSAQRSDESNETPDSDPQEPAALPPRDPSRKVMQIASLTPEETKARQSTALRKSVTVYVPKLINERQNVTRTIMAPVTSQELRPVWSPGEGRWLTYRQTGQTIWAARPEVVTMDVPVWKYVAETRYIDEPVAQRNYYTPIQTSPSAWAWKQPTGAGVQPVIPPYQPSGSRPVLSFLKSRPIIGRAFGGGRPIFPPAPAPVGPVSANYQPVSLYTPNFVGPPPASAIGGAGIPSFIAPPLPTAGAAGNFGGVRTFQ